MFIEFCQIEINNKDVVLSLFKEAAIKIAKMNIDHWQYWKNPPLEKIKWVEEGIENKEFYFIKNTDNETIGMVRILEEDLLYWGKQEDKSLYIHSLVVREQFNKKGVGKIILNKVENLAQQKQYKYLRLDAVSTNTKLCKYYEKQGFNKVGTKELKDTVNNLYQREV
ncbi:MULTISPECIES: GNAT family N-acetyltransferase [unclassified Tenacibaculum]|uniref:GNAT family N-acetyltransferase n=1 Tax=unclassified Tenacibaculum TaxID=2635139 RepID=UPI001F31C7CD|nr:MULTISPECIES: GNAT family N-acetyltransferase [unclassified Tenacibaculum]MCF2874836.1 GNAT family N-acetyltransferase [Tenacibaculum sp. Cn5-1]MCF2934098.1 GNAT family N-acetyltransferase [Tenacibaculum sp. Cn5-34]MCG7510308.1 GNAT family N-acetyltransferase [Tenacibaculum sp. Cn5-46]